MKPKQLYPADTQSTLHASAVSCTVLRWTALKPMIPHQTLLYREEDLIEEDGRQVSAQEIHQYLTRVMYNRRNKFNPLWNSLIVAGVDKDAGL